MTLRKDMTPERRAYYLRESRRRNEAMRLLIEMHRRDWLRIQRELKEAEEDDQ